MTSIAPFPGELRRSNAWGWPYVLTREQKAWLRRFYPCHSTKDLLEASGMNHSLLYRLAKKLRLHKSTEYIETSTRRQREEYKQLIRAERRRQLWGEKRLTELNLPLRPFTQAEVCRRHRAVLMGYILDADSSDKGGNRYVIFYDKDTRRNAFFEKNSIRAGFTIQEWQQ